LNPEKKKRSLFRRLMFVLNVIAMITLLFSYAASFISPDKIWWLALFGLGYGIIFSINLFFIVFWLLLRDRKFWFSLIIILVGFSKILNIFEFHFLSNQPDKKLNDHEYPIKIMSFNVRLFDLYNWTHNHETRAGIFNFLSKESPDIVCFQEYYSCDSTDQDFKNNDTLKKVIPSGYSHIEYSLTLRGTDHWGIATFSKYPIIHKQAVHFQQKGGNIFIFSDLVVGRDTIRVFNTHLESIRFGMKDYKFIENLGNNVEEDEVDRSVSIIRRLKRAFIKRAKQVEVLHQYIVQSPYPVILCGDFNDTPSSYTYSILSDGLKDAFRESGSGFGKTYAGAFPSFRIDYILHDHSFDSYGYQTVRENLSDHYPIICRVEKKNE
jgi:endonuclease/exonuclease/phosphatase family metal-dependent hydrolase